LTETSGNGVGDRAALQRSQRKARDRSVVLLILGILFLMPPFGAIFLLDGTVAGLPVPLFYVFVVWLVLIAGTAWLSRVLSEGDEAYRGGGAPDGED